MSHYLKRNPTSTGSRTKGTWSFWIKRNVFNASTTSTYLFYATAANQGADALRFNDDDGGDSLRSLFWDETNQLNGGFINYDKLRDPSAWMHVVLVYDSTLNTADSFTNHDLTLERMKLFVNGRRMLETGGSAAQNPGIPANNLMTNWGNAGIINSLFATTTGGNKTKLQAMDHFFVDGQALTPDVFAFSKEGDGYYSAGHKYSTDFRSGQWCPRLPKSIKHTINRAGGFGTNGYYLPMNDSSNPGADFHCTPDSIIKLKGEDLPQPLNGAPTTSDVYVSQLREQPGTLPIGDGAVKFGGDGTNSSLKFPDDADLDLDASNFTAECWVYPIDTSGSNYGAIFNKGYSFQVYWKDDIEALEIYASNDGSSYNMFSGSTTVNGSVPRGEWTHIAVVRDGNNWSIYTNGYRTYGPGNDSSTVHNNGNPWAIGDYAPLPGNYELNGLISDFRFVKGTAVYTSNFNPPTTRLTNITNTKLLCCQSSTNTTEAAVSPTTGGTAGGANTFATKNEFTGCITLAVPGISTATGSNLVTNGGFDTDLSGWTTVQATTTWEHGGYLRIVPNSAVNGAVYQEITTVVGQRYTVSMDVLDANPISVPPSPYARLHVGTSTDINSVNKYTHTGSTAINNVSRGRYRTSFTATTTSTVIWLEVGGGAQTQVDFDNVVCKQEDVPRDYSADIRGSGSNLTLTANGNIGVAHNFPSHYGSAINCGGVADYLEVDTPVLGAGNWTIEEWIRQKAGEESQGYWDVSLGVNGDSNTTGGASIYHVHQTAGSGQDGEISFIAKANGYRIFGYQDIRDDAWHHVAVEKHNNVVTLYIDGVAKSSSPDTYDYNSTDNTLIGASKTSSANYYTGQIADVRVYAGVAKYKGGFDVPKPFSILHGDLGIGTESWRVTSDTVKNNFATLNPLSYITTGTYGTHKPVLSNGNLTCAHVPNGHWERTHASFGVGEGKWYYEFMAVDRPVASGAVGENWCVGVRESDSNDFYKETDGFEDIGDHVYWADAGTPKIVSNQDRNAAGVVTSGITAAGDGDIINVAFEKTATTLKVWFGINGTYFNSGNPGSGTNPAVDVASTSTFIIPAVSLYVYAVQNESVFAFNFGQDPSFSGRITAGTEPDGNGNGLFKYLPPSGFLALCDDNLPAPAIADPSKYFKTVLWAGDGLKGRHINVGFKPDFVWLKERSSTSTHALFDIVRGAGHRLVTSTTAAEDGTPNQTLYNPSFNNDGFTVGSDGAVNQSGQTYVAWCWKAGGTAVGNKDGSVESLVSVNQEAGFSIIKFTAQTTANDITVGHGLGKKPSFWIYKPYTNTTGWYCYHRSLGASAWINMDGNNATFSNAAAWGSEPTDTVLTHGQGLANQGDCILYAWAEIEGYSKFGSYLGNQNADGPFVYCGFRPAYVMIKIVTGESRDWHVYDSSRNPVNPVGLNLRPSGNDAENDEPGIDFISNGFKIRADWLFSNDQGSTIVYAAFAESPFTTANAR